MDLPLAVVKATTKLPTLMPHQCFQHVCIYRIKVVVTLPKTTNRYVVTVVAYWLGHLSGQLGFVQKCYVTLLHALCACVRECVCSVRACVCMRVCVYKIMCLCVSMYVLINLLEVENLYVC